MTHPTTTPVSERAGAAMARIAGLEYEDHGDGDTVLFVHGAVVADSFAPMVRHPALDGHRRIRYRRRGYGNSDPFPVEPTIGLHAADASALLDGLGVSRAHVVAHSGGGPVAVQLAADAPDVVRSLVLLEPALFTAATAASFIELTAPLVELFRAGDAARAVHVWMRSVSGRVWRSEVETHVPGAGKQAEADAAATFDGDLPAIGTWAFDAARGRLRQPVLHIAGSRSASTAEPALSMLRETAPDLQHVVIEDADHVNVVLHPSTAIAIAAFLGRQP